MIAMTPNEMEKAIKKANETTVKYTDIDEVISTNIIYVLYARVWFYKKKDESRFMIEKI